MKAFVKIIADAIRDAGDTFVLKIVYVGAKGKRTRRYISPYLFLKPDSSQFGAMCLTTGDYREFITENCSEVTRFPSHLVFMDDGGMPLEILEPARDPAIRTRTRLPSLRSGFRRHR